MEQQWAERWNERYSKSEYAYGKHPNTYLKEQLDKLNPGLILFPAEGEGRNAVYAAKQGWEVSAFDISSEGQKKALQLAKINNVTIDYQVGGLENINFTEMQFDAIALIFAHFPSVIKSKYYKSMNTYLRIGGTIIFEAFSKRHIDYIARNESIGGPRELEMLFSIEEVNSYFPNYDFVELMEKEIELNEGQFHNGLGSVIRFVGRKTV